MPGTESTNASLITDAISLLGSAVADYEETESLVRGMKREVFFAFVDDIQYHFETLWWITFEHPSFAPWLGALEILRRVDTEIMVSDPDLDEEKARYAFRVLKNEMGIRYPDPHPDIELAWQRIFAEDESHSAADSGDWEKWAGAAFRLVDLEG